MFNAELTDNTLESFVANNLDKFNVTQNVVDQHYFNFTQYRAVNAIKNRKYYQLSATKTTADPGEAETYSSFFDAENDTNKTVGTTTFNSNASALNYHTDKHGIPQYDADHCVDKPTEEGTATMETREQWVTFYNGENTVNVNFAEDIVNHPSELGEEPTNDLSNVTSIVIWGYNVPKKYTFKAHYTDAGTYDNGTVSFTNDNQKTLNDNSTVVYIDLATPIMKDGFYNQRIGVEDQRTNLTEQQLAEINGKSGYLNAYGIDTPYFGGTPAEVNAAKTGTVTLTNTDGTGEITTETKSLVFDGWYIHDKNGYHKLCSQRSYENRIMNNLNIFAGYVEASTSSTQTNTSLDVGVAITSNGVDRYIDEDAKQTEKVRYNTLLNVYGKDVPEYAGGDCIVDSAAIYVYLPKTDTNGHYIDWTDQKNINALTTKFADPAVKNQIKSDVKTHMSKVDPHLNNYSVINGQYDYYYTRSTPSTALAIEVNNVKVSDWTKAINCFTFQIVESTPSSTSHQLTLTNKNRLQYTLTMNYDEYINQPFLAFVAIKFVKGSSSDWYVSDNFVSNVINTTAEDETVSNSGTRALGKAISRSTLVEDAVASKSETIASASTCSDVADESVDSAITELNEDIDLSTELTNDTNDNEITQDDSDISSGETQENPNAE